jgi:tetratricopeptide (TPR) repeat protein
MQSIRTMRRKAISLKRDEASFHVNLGTLLSENKKYEKGLQELRKGLSVDPDILKKSEGEGLVAETAQKNTAEQNYFMARFYASMGNADRAVESLQQALTHGFTNLEALRTEKGFDPIRRNEKSIAFMKYAAQLLRTWGSVMENAAQPRGHNRSKPQNPRKRRNRFRGLRVFRSDLTNCDTKNPISYLCLIE